MKYLPAILILLSLLKAEASVPFKGPVNIYVPDNVGILVPSVISAKNPTIIENEFYLLPFTEVTFYPFMKRETHFPEGMGLSERCEHHDVTSWEYREKNKDMVKLKSLIREIKEEIARLEFKHSGEAEGPKLIELKVQLRQHIENLELLQKEIFNFATELKVLQNKLSMTVMYNWDDGFEEASRKILAYNTGKKIVIKRIPSRITNFSSSGMGDTEAKPFAFYRFNGRDLYSNFPVPSDFDRVVRLYPNSIQGKLELGLFLNGACNYITEEEEVSGVSLIIEKAFEILEEGKDGLTWTKSQLNQTINFK